MPGSFPCPLRRTRGERQPICRHARQRYSARMLILVLALPILLTWTISRSLGELLRVRGRWRAVAACGMIVPALLALWSLYWLVPEMLAPPPSEHTDGFPPGPSLLLYAAMCLPFTLATSLAGIRWDRDDSAVFKHRAILPVSDDPAAVR